MSGHRAIRELMTTEVVTVGAATPFTAIAQLLAQYRISAVPVVDERAHVLGVVSEADLLEKQTDADAWQHRVNHGRGAHRRKSAASTAIDLMTAPAVTIADDADVVRAAAMLQRHGVKRLFVIDHAGTLVGVLSRRDALRVFLRGDDDIRAELHHAIQARPASIGGTVDIDVRAGIVTVRGQLPHRGASQRLLSLARHIDGVVDVRSLITYPVDRNTPTPS